MLTHKMQLEFNRQGYRDKDGFSLKTDGIYGNKTRGVYEQYIKDNKKDYDEVIERKNRINVPKLQPLAKTTKEQSEVYFGSNQTNKKESKIFLNAVNNTEKQTLNQWISSSEERRMNKRLNDPKIKEKADQVIKDNAEYIKNAANTFGVNPGILGACIYAEHRRNMEFNDYYLDSTLAVLGKDSSLGVSQVLMSTAKSMEELGYMPKINLNDEGKWGTASIGYKFNSENQARITALEDAQINIMYAAAYLKYIQDIWKEEYPEIDGRTAIMATLYNIGADGSNGPHSNPQPNDFGEFAKDNYYYVRELIGI